MVQAWRVPGGERLLWMRGITTSYRADPVGEYIVGVAGGRAYQLRRGRSSHLVRPGELVVLDPSAAHSGSPAERGAWAGRLLVIELPAPSAAHPGGDSPVSNLTFPAPVIEDRAIARRFLALHRGMERDAPALERQSAVLLFLVALAARSPDAAKHTDDGPRGTGTIMQYGSPGSNRIHSNARGTFQFIVNVDAAQSVSTTPSSGWIPSFGQFAGPFTHRLIAGGVRNRNGTENVSTPLPKWLRIDGSGLLSNRTSRSFMFGPPYQ